MKKTFIILGFIFALAFSCNKADLGPIYSQAKLNGTWENLVRDEDYCRNQLIIADTTMQEKTICANSNTTAYYQTYSFDGRIISVSFLGIKAVYVINELKDSTLAVTLNVSGTNKIIEYKKVKTVPNP